MIPEDYVWLNPLIHERWKFTADKIERHPELLEIPLRNIARWISMDRLGDVRPLLVWRKLIETARNTPEGFLALLELLRRDDEEARFLKSCSPFPGVLTKAERRKFSCAWTH